MQQNMQYFVSSILLYLHSNNEFLTVQKKSYSKVEISGCNGQPENGVSGPEEHQSSVMFLCQCGS